MPQQVLPSSKTPEFDPDHRPRRARELRVQGDAGAFGMLLSALETGEAGIVRGESRDDSAAEWNARSVQQDRQIQRDAVRQDVPRAQEPRDALARLASSSGAEDAGASPAARAQVERTGGESQSKAQPAAVQAQIVQASTEAPQRQAASSQRSEAAATRAQSQGVQPAAVAVAASAASGGTNSGTSASQVSAVANARGPQGGAARGSAPAPQSPSTDRNLRFERVFEAQVGRGLAKALQSGTGTVTLRLKPESLGLLQVRVSVEQQHVRATFEAQTIEAQRMLEASKDSLRHQLEARGLSVERIEVRLVEEPAEAGTRFAKPEDGGADRGQDGRMFSHDRGDRGSRDRGEAEDRTRGGAPRWKDEPSAMAEPWRELGTVRLDAIA